ncbi:MAG TPA: thiol:disulfide interchange protein DsbG [Gammaproteobacteria bacterium]|nr:thiol:disulfide interchange protein DsbG [Gammaproteobacteria bacterium]
MRLILFILAVLLSSLAMAADPAIPPVLKNLQNRGIVVDHSFPGPDGLTGWIVRVSGRPMVVFTTPSGDYAMNGELVDKSGNNLTRQYQQRYFPHTAPADVVALLEKDGSLVDEGQAKAPLIYVYADANCVFCNRFWTELRPYVRSGKVHVRWAMLAFLKQTSAGRAAAILAAKDKVAALTEDETKFDKAKEEGGIPPLEPVPYDLRAALLLHSSQMDDLGGHGTPLILYHQPDGWHQTEGLPQDISKFIDDLTPGDPDTH